MSIQHLIKGNSNRDSRINANSFNLAVERISGFSHRKLEEEQAAKTGRPAVQAEASDAMEEPKMPPSAGFASAAYQTAAQTSSRESFLASKVAQLEHRLEQYESFGDQDNDVASATTTPAKRLNRGADSAAMGSNVIREKNRKTKDPADGKPDGLRVKKQPEAQMAGEKINLIGISMNEWRSMAGLPSPRVDLTARPTVEAFDDVEESVAVRSAMRSIGVKVKEPVPPPVDSTDRAKLGMKPLAVQKGSTVASRSALKGIAAMHANRRSTNEAIEHELWAEFLESIDLTPAEFSAFVERADRARDMDALLAVEALEDEFIEAWSAYNEANGSADDDQDQWSMWLESRGLSLDIFDGLVESIESESDLLELEDLRAMFEAEIVAQRVAGAAPGPSDKELVVPGKSPQKLQSVAHGQIKPSRKGNFSLPPAMRAKLGMPKEEDDEAFECDDDGSGNPDMSHPGWAKAMKRFKKNKKRGGKS